MCERRHHTFTPILYINIEELMKATNLSARLKPYHKYVVAHPPMFDVPVDRRYVGTRKQPHALILRPKAES